MRMEKKGKAGSSKMGKEPLSIKLGKFRYRVSQQKLLILMTVPFIVWVLIFKYWPLIGWLMAFQDYKLGNNFFESQFVGFKHFEVLFQDERFYRALRNTLAMSFLGLTFGFVAPIIFALLLNELKHKIFKNTVQTVSYLPHFVSWVITASLITQMLSSEGAVNQLLVNLGFVEHPVNFLGTGTWFWGLITVIDIWKEVGWNAIIYLAAITGVDQALYEAAEVDGAGRFRKIWNITLPSIMPVIAVLLIMNIGWLINIGYEKQFLLGNTQTVEFAEVLDLYALNNGIGSGRYSYATAIGMFKSVISIVLVFSANFIAKKAGQKGVV